VEGTSNIEHPTSNVEFHVGRVGFNARNSSTIHDPQSTVCNPVRTALFLSRIHPKKGLPLLLEVWARLRPQGWQLRIVGPDEGGHLAELKRLCEKLGLEWEDEANIEHRRGDEGDSLASTPTERRYKAEQVTDPFNIQHSKFNILFSGPLDGEEKWRAYRAADLFVLPTYSENFGIAVAEALACSVPVITTTGAPWAGLLDRRCGWWVAPEVDAIGRALEEAIGMNDAEREAMGGRGAVWVREDFVWEGIARRVIDGYGEILNVG
jgi:glycosyltransferase involved in cell wall biosynthesis